MSGQQIASIVAYRIDQDQFDELVSVGDAIQRMSEAVTRLAPPIIHLRLTHRKSGFTVEGANLKMNLKNNEEVDYELVFKNAQGGPAAIQPGSVKAVAVTPTGAFTVEQNPDDEKKGTIRGNPQSAGGPDDIGTVDIDFDGDAGTGEKPQKAQGAINVIAGDAEISELKFGEPRPQTTTPPPAPAPEGTVTP